jgi:hypothetical protein
MDSFDATTDSTHPSGVVKLPGAADGIGAVGTAGAGAALATGATLGSAGGSASTWGAVVVAISRQMPSRVADLNMCRRRLSEIIDIELLPDCDSFEPQSIWKVNKPCTSRVMFNLAVSLRTSTRELNTISSMFAPVLGYAGATDGSRLQSVMARDGKSGSKSRTCGSK